jgi:tetratricopeptide (TPR) repeat protein
MDRRELLNEAVRLHQLNKFDEAEPMYLKLLLSAPENIEIRYLLGVLLHQSGRHREAADYLEKVVATDPTYAEAFNSLGNVYQAIGDIEKAEAGFRRAIELKPTLAIAYLNYAGLLQQIGNEPAAIEVYKKGIHADPAFLPLYQKLGEVSAKRGNLPEAEKWFRQALKFAPRDDRLLTSLGLVLQSQNRLAEAVHCFQSIIDNAPGSYEAINQLGMIYEAMGFLDKAEQAFSSALSIQPTYAEACYNKAGVLAKTDRYEEALSSYKHAVELKPNFPQAFNNWGFALQEQGNLDDALRQYEKAISLDPEFADAHWNYALALLLCGRFEEGWREYEWRWRSGQRFAFRDKLNKIEWDGSISTNSRLLLYAEQGLGDAIQFVRYIPLVMKRCSSIVLAVHIELTALFRQAFPGIAVQSFDQFLPEYDAHCSLLSLPRLMGTGLDNIPSHVSYLKSKPEQTAVWKEKFQDAGGLINVGIVWRGNPKHKRDRHRSVSLKAFERFTSMKRMRLYSLQKDAEHEELHRFQGQLIDYTENFTDFISTAACLEHMDIVVSVDTSVAHLAGALGKPVWLLLPKIPDWRWLLHREDSPWYPSMKLFRQRENGDWSSVFDAVQTELDRFDKKYGSTSSKA